MRFSLSVIVLSLVAADWSAAQDFNVKPTPRAFLGETDCFTCHTLGLPDPNDPKLKAIKARFPKMVLDSWVKMDEWSTWGGNDKHNQAYISLLPDNARAKRMSELLGVEVHRDKRCLACHVGYPLSAMNSDPQAAHLIHPDSIKDPKIAQGVTCEGCHAPSGDGVDAKGTKLEGWNTPHRFKDTWRFLSGTEKETKYGYADVRSASSRARICLSCHLGNAAQGKVVTHEMYAAGHPPLPGFELTTFVAQMPKHWRDFVEKSPNIRDEFLTKSEEPIYGRPETFKPGDLHSTTHLLVAAIVAYSENLKLSSQLAKEQVSPAIAKPSWPELAQFECYACHHDLQDKSWRQARKLRGLPGRPLLRSWPTPLTKLSVTQATGGKDDDKFAAVSHAVEDLLNKQPFGSQSGWDDVLKTAAWLDELAKALEKKPLARQDGWMLLQKIADTAQSELWDYDSARQLVWAAQVLRAELSSKDHGDETTRNRLAQLSGDFVAIEELFVLRLIDGQTAKQQFPGETESREVNLVDLVKTLPKIARYDAITFRDQFRKLAAKLK